MAGDFSIPKFVSPLGKEMIMGLLTTDPEKRYRLKDIRSHPWFKSMTETPLPSNFGIKVGVNAMPIDLSIISQISEYKENTEEAKKYVENNRHNHSITIYYLLLKKQLRNGIHSQFDINSPNFDQSLLKKKEETKEKEVSEAATASADIDEIQLDRLTTAAFGPRSNRIISRLSHLRENRKK